MITALRQFPRLRVAIAAAGIFVVGAALYAQTDVTTSRISGTVRAAADRSVLPGVTVTARNQENGLSRTSSSDRDGFYQIINLPTGRYTVTASLQAFRPGVTEEIRIDIGMSPTIDFSLQVEGVTESVTASATVPTIEVTNTAV